MILHGKFFIILLLAAGLIQENFGYDEDTDDILPSSRKSKLISNSDNELQPPRRLQIARGLGQARLKLLKGAKNLKLRLSTKRNGLRGLSQRGQLNKNLNSDNGVSKNGVNVNNGFDENTDATNNNNYFVQNPYMVGDDNNMMWNYNTNNNAHSSNENQYEFLSQNIHHLPTVRYQNDNGNVDNGNNKDAIELIHSSKLPHQNIPKQWWENQDTSQVVSHNYHNNHQNIQTTMNYNENPAILDTIQSNRFNDESSFEEFSETHFQPMNAKTSNQNFYGTMQRNTMEASSPQNMWGQPQMEVNEGQDMWRQPQMEANKEQDMWRQPQMEVNSEQDKWAGSQIEVNSNQDMWKGRQNPESSWTNMWPQSQIEINNGQNMWTEPQVQTNGEQGMWQKQQNPASSWSSNNMWSQPQIEMNNGQNMWTQPKIEPNKGQNMWRQPQMEANSEQGMWAGPQISVNDDQGMWKGRQNPESSWANMWPQPQIEVNNGQNMWTEPQVGAYGEQNSWQKPKNSESTWISNEGRNYQNFQMNERPQDQMKMQAVEETKQDQNSEMIYRTSDVPGGYNFQNEQPLVWYGFNNEKPTENVYRMPENVYYYNPAQTSAGKDYNQDSQQMPELLVGAPNLKNDDKMNEEKQPSMRNDDHNMAHLKEDDENVNPVIMQEYLQAIRGHRHTPRSPMNSLATEDKDNLRKNTNYPEKFQIFKSNSKDSLNKGEKTKEQKSEDELGTQKQHVIEYSPNQQDLITTMNMAEAISQAEQKILKIEEALEKTKQSQVTLDQLQKDEKKLEDDNQTQSTDPKAIVMALHARELQKRRTDDESLKTNAVNEEPTLQRYLLTSASNEWVRGDSNFRMASKENKSKEENEKSKDDTKKTEEKVAKIIMRDSANTSQIEPEMVRASPEDIVGVPNINIPHSGYTVFEPTRIVHYRTAGPAIEILKDGKIPVFEEPQTEVKVDASYNTDTPAQLPQVPRSMQMYNPSGGMYAMQYDYKRYLPQTSLSYHQPAYRWPIAQPLTYTYEGVQYRYPASISPALSFPTNPILMAMGPQVPEHARTFTPGNLFGLSRYNSGYGGPFEKLAYYHALENKHQNHHGGFRHISQSSNKVEKTVAPQKRGTKSSGEHILTKRNTQQHLPDGEIVRSNRHKRETRSGPPPPSKPGTCPCFTSHFYGPYNPAYQSPAMPYDPESSYAARNDPMVGTPFTRILSRPYMGLLTPDRYRRRWFAPHEFIYPGSRHHRFQRSNGNYTDDEQMPFFIDRNLVSAIESNIIGDGGLLDNVRHTLGSGLDLVLPRRSRNNFNKKIEEGHSNQPQSVQKVE